nr:VWA domain-containing protein [Solirubrobacterales bacterium]
RRKADVAEGVATVAARLATRRGNRMALVTCGAAVERVLPPRGGRGALTHLRRVLAEGVATDTHPPSSGGRGGSHAGGIGDGLRRADALARGHGLVVVISDFLEAPEVWERSLGALRHRHDVIAVECRDQRDEELPDVGTVWLRDPVSGRELQVDTGRAATRRRFGAAAAERHEASAQAFARRGVRHAICRTDGDWLGSLGTVLR